jgi:hypothetical protein
LKGLLGDADRRRLRRPHPELDQRTEDDVLEDEIEHDPDFQLYHPHTNKAMELDEPWRTDYLYVIDNFAEKQTEKPRFRHILNDRGWQTEDQNE